jgi:hypothetical protein
VPGAGEGATGRRDNSDNVSPSNRRELSELSLRPRVFPFSGPSWPTCSTRNSRPYDPQTPPTPESALRLRNVWKASGRKYPRVEGNGSELAALEGLATESRQYVRGRSAALRNQALARARGRCEACRRDYSGLLDGMGTSVLQVPQEATGSLAPPQLTHLSELAVVCANCHALVHRDPKNAIPVQTLRRWLARSTRS